MANGRRTTGALPDRSIRLVVVEPHSILGMGLREVLDGEPDIDVIATVNTTDEAIGLIGRAAPDVVLVDVALLGADEAEAARRLRQGVAEAALVVLGRGDDASIVEAVEIGATGHVAVRAQPADLVATIRRAAAGQDPIVDDVVTRPDLVERIIETMREAILADVRPANPLTPREREILGRVGAGLRNREIAEELGVSEQTIKNHLSSTLHKLGVPNRTRAVTYATRHGWLTLSHAPEPQQVADGES
ncbi:MAG TPA: response regulator transcription factor [Candidatus Limnocylindrales bacterium]|nr:response regulator transcription factor [Candidatus Limnocylindrales bacterium]